MTADEDGTAITDRKEVCRLYLRSWFLIDLISSIPFDFLLTANLSLITLLKVGLVARECTDQSTHPSKV